MNKKKIENEFQKTLAIEYVRPFCIEHGLAVEKLKTQRFLLSYDECVFAQPSGVKPDGLRNDMETMPKPTLLIKYKNDCLRIEQTEYTEQYLKIVE